MIATLANHDVPLSDTLIAEGYAWLRDGGKPTGEPISLKVGNQLVRELGLVD